MSIKIEGRAYFNIDHITKMGGNNMLLISAVDKKTIMDVPIWIQHGENPVIGEANVGRITDVNILGTSVYIVGEVYEEYKNFVTTQGYKCLSIGYHTTTYFANNTIIDTIRNIKEISLCFDPKIKECFFRILSNNSNEKNNFTEIEIGILMSVQPQETKENTQTTTVSPTTTTVQTQPTTVTSTISCEDQMELDLISMTQEEKDKMLVASLRATRSKKAQEIAEKEKAAEIEFNERKKSVVGMLSKSGIKVDENTVSKISKDSEFGNVLSSVTSKYDIELTQTKSEVALMKRKFDELATEFENAKKVKVQQEKSNISGAYERVGSYMGIQPKITQKHEVETFSNDDPMNYFIENYRKLKNEMDNANNVIGHSFKLTEATKASLKK